MGGGRWLGGSFKVTLLPSPSIPVQLLSLLPHLEEGGGTVPNRQATEEPRDEEGFWGSWCLFFSKYRVPCLLHARP